MSDIRRSLQHGCPGRPKTVRATRRMGLPIVLTLLPMAAAADLPPPGQWDFVARLDGRPVGSHRFVLEAEGPDGAQRRLVSEARFDVKLLGLTVYRYRHRAEERWQGDCLASLTARTDDDGAVTEVEGRRSGADFTLRVDGAAASASASGAASTSEESPSQGRTPERSAGSSCVMSFAYWHPTALAARTRLLDPATGRLEPVRLEPVAERPMTIGGREMQVRGLRIAGLEKPIELWYAGDRWVGLDAVVDGKRMLSYRLADGGSEAAGARGGER